MFLRRYLSTPSVLRENLIKELQLRGLIAQISKPEKWLVEKLQSRDNGNNNKVKLYCGVDPTAKSLHLGNLVPLMVLLNFYVRGHSVVTLVGGATGRVGDPSGRITERSEMATDIRANNIEAISEQLVRFFKNGKKYYERKNKHNTVEFGEHILKDNYSWWKEVKMLDFLAQYGRHIRVQAMLSRDSVTSRLANQGSLGFNEFTYQILQAYDFFHLYKEHNVSIQVGGNDQWGNITAGLDLIGRLEPKSKELPAFAVTTPLLSTANGEKFGKSAGNAVFIDPEINTPFEIFQFFYNTEDADIARFLQIFTLLPRGKIQSIVADHLRSPHLRKGQNILAKEVTELLHGVDASNEAEEVSNVLFGKLKRHEKLDASRLIELCSKARILQHANKSENLIDLLARLTNDSKSAAKRKISQGSIYLHSDQIKVSESLTNWDPYLIDNKVLLMKIGKQKTFVIEMK
ncbi:tyrosine--tRNA ligase MSY1 NDAI_0C05730 [Naumovozyma dairenensis CBS 421]|uniref:Tyrosine--tRNA ligase n=1 Tax=Naumovozyma dairenensis (strain ATCC 10597 / BCRC 20456 / CBS 421 / NBRC 0211 / NRRL Y-12639) TaxID=1071378 RepID=G0W8X1_NAUDC|nr:hypothetical protein NDAI_0C05730 [Naumovozyma dairenensis CBS 421]CCD24232.1 hypothetical protein NDAI_0C05730 [Naumovozyma dairenensis CBS 421]